MNITNETITVNIKTNKFGPTIRVGESWVQTTEALYNQLDKGKTFTVEIQTDDKGKKKLTNIIKQEETKEVKKPTYEKKAEATKAEFRSPDQIMRSSALGLASSFVAQSLQNDLDTPVVKKAELIFEILPRFEKYIQGE